jgi:DNA invertase Pin-like site-specific DNA recombinase
MLVAIYARHSTDKQNGSASDQITRCRQYCAQRGYIVVEAYADEALSGASMNNRPGLNALMTAAVEGDFDCIITEDLSRISRDQGDVATFYKKMNFIDVSIETVSEGQVSELHIGLKGTMNALYLKDLADKTRRGQIASVLKGAVPGGRCYGYDVVRRFDENGELLRGAREINPGEADVVRQIFREYYAGHTLKRICRDLNAMGYPSPTGGQWAPTTLIGTAARQTGLLRQTLYKGVITFNKMLFKKHPDTGKRLSVPRPESEWISAPIPELAIIDDELFDAVQDQIVARSSQRRTLIEERQAESAREKAERHAARLKKWRLTQVKPRQNVLSVFSGRLWCATHEGKIATMRKRYYGCPAKACRNRGLPWTELMALSLDALDALSHEDFHVYFSSAAVVTRRCEHETAIAELQPRIDERRQEVHGLLKALGARSRTESVRIYLDEQEQEIRRLRMEQIKHERRPKALTPDPAKIEHALKAHRLLVANLREDPENHVYAYPLRNGVSRFTVTEEYEPETDSWARRIIATFDIPKVLELADGKKRAS